MSTHDHTTYPLFGESPVSGTEPVEFRIIAECHGYRFGSDGSAWTIWRRGTGEAGPWRLVPTNSIDGRKRIRLKHRLDGMNQCVNLSHLVCWAWHGPCPEGLSVQYRDGEVSNTRPDNLFWGTGLEHLTEGRKRCTGCGEVKPLGEFSKHPTNRDRFNFRCKACVKEYQKLCYSRPEARAKLKDGEIHRKRKSRYGITKDEHEMLLAGQGGVCAICKKPPQGGKRTGHLHVDHDHVTNKCRGLICLNCNTALGHLGDNLDGLMRAIDYLVRGDPESRRRVVERYTSPEP